MLGLLSWQNVSMDPIMMAGKKKFVFINTLLILFSINYFNWI